MAHLNKKTVSIGGLFISGYVLGVMFIIYKTQWQQVFYIK
jgi:hypothetical protein